MDVAASISQADTPAASTPKREAVSNSANTITPAKREKPLFYSWETTASNNFGLRYGDDVKDRLQKRIDLLATVMRSHDGYRQFVTNIEEEALSEKQRHKIENKCRYLRVAYVRPTCKLKHSAGILDVHHFIFDWPLSHSLPSCLLIAV